MGISVIAGTAGRTSMAGDRYSGSACAVVCMVPRSAQAVGAAKSSSVKAPLPDRMPSF